MFRVERQLNSFTNKSFVTFWVGGREIKSQWVWSHGEYMYETTRALSDSFTAPDGHSFQS